MADIEKNVPVNVKLISIEPDVWTAKISRRSNEKDYWIADMRDLSPSDVYYKFGVEVPTEKASNKSEGRANAVDLLRDRLTAMKGRATLSASEVNDILLDAINELNEDED